MRCTLPSEGPDPLTADNRYAELLGIVSSQYTVKLSPQNQGWESHLGNVVCQIVPASFGKGKRHLWGWDYHPSCSLKNRF